LPVRPNRFKRVREWPVTGSGAFLYNLGCRGDSAGLIIATVTIDNVTADVVIDTGASASFLPLEGSIIKSTKAELVATKTNTRIADNGQLDCTNSTTGNVRVWAGKVYQYKARFLVINGSSHILGYDALFGNDIIKALNIEIVTHDKLLVARIKNHVIGEEDTVVKHERHLALAARLRQSPVPETVLECLLKRYPDVFSETAEGTMKIAPMQIQLTSDSMPKAKLRRYAVEDVAEISRQIKSMLDRKIIEPSISPFSSTCHLVPKKNGQQRLVINFIPLNRISVKDHYPLPQIPDLLAHLVDAKFFCALDCTEGFWQVPVKREDRVKTAFVTPEGLFQFRRCPFGYTNSPAIFQRAMNDIFKDGLYKRCVIYIDDVLVFGKTEEETILNLDWVFRKCEQFNVKLKLSKCEFLKTSVKFLGYRVGQGDVRPLTDKCQPWQSLQPATVKEAQAFLGYINYYSRFIKDFSEKTNPIRKAIQIQPFSWSSDCSEAKDLLLRDLQSATSQRIPHASTPKRIEIAVLDNSIEAACLTEQDELIMRTSATLSSTQRNYSSLEKELLALIRAYNKFGPFLRGPVTVKTACTLLPHTLRLKDKPERVARLLLQLPPDADFKVEASNNVVETIQRMDAPPEDIFYTDGAFKSKGEHSLASWAVVSVNRPELNSTGTMKNSSNQKAELEAVIQACRIATENNLKRILIVTDSRYASNGVSKWIERWAENGWRDNKNKPVINQETFKRLAKVMENLDVRITHVKGHQGDKYNELADQLAREALTTEAQVCATIHSPPDLDQDSDEELRALREAISANRVTEGYKLKNGTICMVTSEGDKVLVPKDKRQILLRLAHNDPIYGGHYGVKKTRKKLEHYHWSGIGTDVAKFVASCEICQRNKNPKSKVYGKLMPIKTSDLFNRVHMDIIGPMTASDRNNKFIITAVDAFSRMGFARACAIPTGEEVVSLLRDEIVYRHGPPKHIITDNGTQFRSEKFKAMVDGLGIQHSTTCEYHPQANGMDEKFNGTLVKIIRNCLQANKRDWDEILPAALLAYNLTPNDSTRISPYTIVYGRLPRSPLNPVEIEEPDDELMHDEIRQEALENSGAAHDKMESQYNRNKRDPKFQPFDSVMVKALSLGRTDSRKFSSKWTGPHLVLRLLEHGGVPRAVEILDCDRFKVRRIPFGAVKDYLPPREAPAVILPGEAITSSLRRETVTLRSDDSNGEEIVALPLLPQSPPLQILSDMSMTSEKESHKGVNPLGSGDTATLELTDGERTSCPEKPDSRREIDHEGVNPEGLAANTDVLTDQRMICEQLDSQPIVREKTARGGESRPLQPFLANNSIGEKAARDLCDKTNGVALAPRGQQFDGKFELPCPPQSINNHFSPTLDTDIPLIAGEDSPQAPTPSTLSCTSPHYINDDVSEQQPTESDPNK